MTPEDMQARIQALEADIDRLKKDVIAGPDMVQDELTKLRKDLGNWIQGVSDRVQKLEQRKS